MSLSNPYEVGKSRNLGFGVSQHSFKESVDEVLLHFGVVLKRPNLVLKNPNKS